MEGDWIKMRTDLSEDPIVLAIAARLKVDEFSIVGRLHRIWSWADRHLVDGVALGITIEWIDQYVRLEGFSIALLEMGWLNKIEKENLPESRKDLLDSFSETFLDSSRFLLEGGDLGGVVFPRFFRYLQGKTLNTNTKTNPTPTREREIEKESRKQIEKEIEKGSSRIEKDEAFSIFWKQYPRKDSKVPAQKAFDKIAPDAELQQKILDAVQRFKSCDQWVREGGKFIPFASTWLNQRRWEDEPLMASAVASRPTFTTARDESRQRAYQVLTGKTAAPQPEVQPAEVINGHVKLLG